MAILNFQLSSIGQTGLTPIFIYLDTDDSAAEVTIPGYLNTFVAQGNLLDIDDLAVVSTKDAPYVSIFNTTYSGGNWSLVPYASSSGAGGWHWVTVSSATVMAPGYSYISNSASQVAFTLPAGATAGQTFQIVGANTGGWIINLSGQTVHVASAAATVSVASGSSAFNGITLVCTAPNVFVSYPSGTYTLS